jgi:hypothetical protein
MPAVQRLRSDPRLTAFHRSTLSVRVRQRGDIDVNLVVGLAKLADAESAEEIPTLLTRPELIAVLSDPNGFQRATALPGASYKASRTGTA